MGDTTVLVDGLAFPEGPRWHESRLWFSDMHALWVKAVDEDGKVEQIVEVAGRPSGLGWDVDGRLLVVSMADRRLLRFDGSDLTQVADMTDRVARDCNDMVVDRQGRAYIGNFGFDLHAGDTPTTTVLLMVDADAAVHEVADGLRFPNGMVITPDGSTLIVGESYGACLTAFAIAADGTLSDRREFAATAPAVPDGICLDEDGAVWVASPLTNEVIRVREGGEITDRISTGDRGAYACMLGGADRRTLFVCTSGTMIPAETVVQRTGRIETVGVDVPGAGLP